VDFLVGRIARVALGAADAVNAAWDGTAGIAGLNSEGRRAGKTQLVSEMEMSTPRRQHLVSNVGMDLKAFRMTALLYSLHRE